MVLPIEKIEFQLRVTYVRYPVCGARFSDTSVLVCQSDPNHDFRSHTHYAYDAKSGNEYFSRMTSNVHYFTANHQLSLFPEFSPTFLVPINWYPLNHLRLQPRKTKQDFYDHFWMDGVWRSIYRYPFTIAFDVMSDYKDEDSPDPTEISEDALTLYPDRYTNYKKLKKQGKV